MALECLQAELQAYLANNTRTGLTGLRVRGQKGLTGGGGRWCLPGDPDLLEALARTNSFFSLELKDRS